MPTQTNQRGTQRPDGFAVRLEAETDSSLAMLIAVDQEGNYHPSYFQLIRERKSRYWLRTLLEGFTA